MEEDRLIGLVDVDAKCGGDAELMLSPADAVN